MIKTTPQLNSYEYASQEDRSAQRTRIAIPGYLRAAGAKRVVTNTRDISRSGFAAIAMSRLTPNTRCWLTLPEAPALEAEVVWWEGGVVGCAFKQILEPSILKALIDRWS